MQSAPAPVSDQPEPQRLRVRVRGAVQGVGFRPFVWGLARDLDLSGWVLNDSEGVLIEVEGASVSRFLDRLPAEAPPLARLDAVEPVPVPGEGSGTFEIRHSARGAQARTMVTPDMATCPDCLDDILDPDNRRYGYPFTNCTHCGPRHTITHTLPYDRAQTSMASFQMCPDCQAEYDDPADRRFHAQPNACPACGPQLSMAVPEIAGRLIAGEIVAIKGLGGFHLAVDARNPHAVDRLRARKQRDGKPFAVMVADPAAAQALADLDQAETDALTGRARPIVVVRARADAGLVPGVSNGLPTVGLMLPYTPLHTLLFQAAAEASQPLALVMTSANLGGDPLVTDNDDAHLRLTEIADTIVTHDREIVVRCDDSVVRVIGGAPAFLRRARGFTPEPIKLARACPPILAVGGHLKNTICVIRDDEAFLSHHIGDLDDPETYRFFRETVTHFTDILDVTPDRIACDLHPDFLSTRYAQESGLPVVRVQHHQAHIAALMAEHRIGGPLLGLALDGFGLGADGVSSWGGERLLINGAEWTHLGGFAPLRQPGGDAAARAPWRMAAAALHALGEGESIPGRFRDHPGADMLAVMLERGVNAPETSSAGRFFDAACGLLGVKPVASFEGEAPMALEALVTVPETVPGCWTIKPDGTLDLLPLLRILSDMDPVRGANVLHGTLTAALADWVLDALDRHAVPRRVALSGGCLQNKILAECLTATLSQYGVEALLPRQAPANDGGLSLGQAWVAACSDG